MTNIRRPVLQNPFNVESVHQKNRLKIVIDRLLGSLSNNKNNEQNEPKYQISMVILNVYMKSTSNGVH